MLYQAYQNQSDLMSPFRLLTQSTSAALWLNKTEGSFLRKISASMEVFSRMRLTHSRPPYDITSVKAGGHELAVTEESVLKMPFGTLLRFRKEATGELPPAAARAAGGTLVWPFRHPAARYRPHPAAGP